jgi:hypothetical protein
LIGRHLQLLRARGNGGEQERDDGRKNACHGNPYFCLELAIM